jgi:hypothetical protein
MAAQMTGSGITTRRAQWQNWACTDASFRVFIAAWLVCMMHSMLDDVQLFSRIHV